ncbi:MAG: DUF4062 domain-containing protein [Bacteroidales bacterium]|nr:DUF4062 domain-containing protein [Bacteroidales bacterium]
MVKTVFISSTFQDLKEHRSKVWDLLQKYDVNIRGMEQFGARKENTLTTCLSECEICDIYIGIIGMRYGSIHEESGKSYTMLEYEKALEKNKDILFFLIDETDSKITPSFVDTGSNREKLDSFKNLIKERHTIAFFIDPEDLETKMELSLNEKLNLKEEKGKIKSDDIYEISRDKIDNFLLMPKSYSGKSIDILCNVKGEPFPASRKVCSNFNYNYGKTVGVRIEILKPYVKNLTNYLFIEHDQYEDFIKLPKNEILLKVALKFSEEVISAFEAHFVREEFIQYRTSDFYWKHDPNYFIFKDEKIVYEPEGTIILQYIGHLENS